MLCRRRPPTLPGHKMFGHYTTVIWGRQSPFHIGVIRAPSPALHPGWSRQRRCGRLRRGFPRSGGCPTGPPREAIRRGRGTPKEPSKTRHGKTQHHRSGDPTSQPCDGVHPTDTCLCAGRGRPVDFTGISPPCLGTPGVGLWGCTVGGRAPAPPRLRPRGRPRGRSGRDVRRRRPYGARRPALGTREHGGQRRRRHCRRGTLRGAGWPGGPCGLHRHPGGGRHHPRGRGHGHTERDYRACGNAEIQLPSRRMPAAPLFSGWNCVADSGPFSTAARNGVP